MRTVLIAIGLLACATALAGCGLWDRLTAPPKPQIVTCRCAPPLRGAQDVGTRGATPARRYAYRRYTRRHRYHRRYAHSGAYRWHKRYAERSVDIYNYSSHSQRYGAHEYGHGGGYAYRHGYGYGHGYGERHGYHHRGWRGHQGRSRYAQVTEHVWADGYGRRHIYDESAVRHYTYAAHQRARQLPQRLDPWHGYDDDWD